MLCTQASKAIKAMHKGYISKPVIKLYILINFPYYKKSLRIKQIDATFQYAIFSQSNFRNVVPKGGLKEKKRHALWPLFNLLQEQWMLCSPQPKGTPMPKWCQKIHMTSTEVAKPLKSCHFGKKEEWSRFIKKTLIFRPLLTS